MLGEAKALGSMAAVLWAIVAVASLSMLCGNPTAINAVVGVGIPATVLTTVAIAFHLADRRAP
ncbi:hypothetical protein [Streptomyces sp. NPDC006477]|uniref:hypothetical protein n=1 Tax=Streptomyces sp. NPDC006477 TaxID=3364747 RepID=UPI0036BF8A1D